MVITARTDSFVSPTLTQQSVYDGIKTAFANAGYPAPFDEFTSGTDRVVVYAVVLDATKTYGTSYLRIRLTTGFVIGQQLFSTWAIATHTGTNGNTEITYTAFTTNIAVNFVSLNGGAEYKLVLAYQGTIYVQLGFVSPENRPSWWDLNAWNYCYLPTTNTFSVYRSTALNPFANTENDTNLGVSRMSIANVITNRRDILPGVVLFTQANQGIVGRTSDDFVMVAASGMTRFDIVQIPGDTRQYLLLNSGNGALALRFA